MKREAFPIISHIPAPAGMLSISEDDFETALEDPGLSLDEYVERVRAFCCRVRALEVRTRQADGAPDGLYTYACPVTLFGADHNSFVIDADGTVESVGGTHASLHDCVECELCRRDAKQKAAA